MRRRHPKPVAAERQWTLWPRIARPYACRTCGHEYPCSFDDEIESKQRQFMVEVSSEDAASTEFRWGVDRRTRHYTHDRYAKFLFCVNPDCARFFDYGLEADLREKHGNGRMAMFHAPSMGMRKRWLALPRAANGGQYP